jgi:VIT1/CCC1 family predicted Fe2+/Mn2+ transporter
VSEQRRHAAGRRPGERLVQVGAAVFLAGVLGVLGVVLPFFLGRDEAGQGWAVLASVAPLGLAIALVGLVRQSRAARRGD